MEGATQLLAEGVRTFISGRLTVKLEVFDKGAEKKLREASEEEQGELRLELRAARERLLEKYQTVTWLTDAAKRAGQISMVTHAPKYTHSDTRSMGILLQPKDIGQADVSEPYLNTLSLADPAIDVVGNAAALDVAGLLKLKADGVSLLEQVATGESAALRDLAPSSELLQEWLGGFMQALQGKQPASGQLSKQLYFPLSGSQYHLLGPLYASSLSEILYDRLTDSFYSDAPKAARQAKKHKRYHPDIAVSYPDIALQGHGGTKPQNISQLNTSRYGRSYLLSSQPPTWKQQLTPPVGKNAFWREYDRRAWKVAQSLRKYLENILDKTSTKPRRDVRTELVDELMDRLLVFAAEVQNLRGKAGWSQESELSSAEQLWLDPHRGNFDAAFKQEREKNDWQTDISKQFASWLNRKISEKSDKLFTGDPEFNEWKKLLSRKLTLLKEDLEVAV